MTNFPILYSFDRKGNVRIFEAMSHEDSYTTRYGVLGGSLVAKTKKVSIKNVGKSNQTTLQEQAESEASSKWTEKLNDGYKPLEWYIEKVHEISDGVVKLSPVDESNISATKEQLFIIYNKLGYFLVNSNKDWLPLPMLATPLKKVKNPPKKVIVQRKYNGVRCIARLINDEVILMSRGGEYYNVPHLAEQLGRVYDFISKDVVFDGEIYKHDTPLQTISGAVRKQENTMFSASSTLEYHIYDCAMPQIPQIDRINIVESLLPILLATEPSIIPVPSATIDFDMDNIKQLHDDYVGEGYEGVILRDVDAFYEPGTRSKSLIKVKEFEEEVFTILGAEVDTNKSIGDSFVFVLQNNTNSSTFKARPTGSIAMKEKWYKDIWRLKGKGVIVRFFERSEDDIPIHGHVRHKESIHLH